MQIGNQFAWTEANQNIYLKAVIVICLLRRDTLTLAASCLMYDMETQDMKKTLAFVLQYVYLFYKHGKINHQLLAQLKKVPKVKMHFLMSLGSFKTYSFQFQISFNVESVATYYRTLQDTSQNFSPSSFLKKIYKIKN